jgi:hypothetical protein
MRNNRMQPIKDGIIGKPIKIFQYGAVPVKINFNQ